MALLLSIETSTHHFSCALHRDDQLIAFEKSDAEQTTASMLAIMIKRLFDTSSTKIKELSAVIIASGPGSYTGLRIGVATAKGICYALNVPLISVNTLFLMFRQFRTLSDFELEDSQAAFCPMLDARRMEVYCWMCDKDGNTILPIQAKVINEDSFTQQLNERLVFFFGEAEKCKDLILHPHARFVSGILPSARMLGNIGLEKFRQKDFEDLAHFEPFYLKDFVIKKPNPVS